ncbi:MAG: hypothetical protein ACI3VR_00780 [Intestinibacter sp.]|uniref:hypothetical protein n=1 Tax=Intestinibacter sp. TaxID=1965304 RepID=UPI003F178CB0
MANHRMFSRSIVGSDDFLEMPATSRLLYYDLGMAADDDGFVSTVNSILRVTGARKDDINVLEARGYIKKFKSGIIIVLDWLQNNCVRPNIYKASVRKERNYLQIGQSNRYIINDNKGVVLGPQKSDIPRIGDIINSISINPVDNPPVDKQTKENNAETDIGSMEEIISKIEKILQLLETVGIKRNTTKAQEIATTYNYDDVKASIRYAEEHMPPVCRNTQGWYISCIEEGHGIDDNECWRCKGTGKISIFEDKWDNNGASVEQRASECPDCKGTGRVRGRKLK